MAKRKRRTFTPEFKAEVVLEALRGESSQAELCRKPHNLSEDQFFNRLTDISQKHSEVSIYQRSLNTRL